MFKGVSSTFRVLKLENNFIYNVLKENLKAFTNYYNIFLLTHNCINFEAFIIIRKLANYFKVI